MKKSCSRLAAITVLIACGGDKATEPIPQTTAPADLQMTFPDTVTRGQAFSLTVTALDAQGQRNAGWSGTVTLSSSAGSITPITVNVSSGTATVQATIAQHAGAVSITSSVGT